MRPSQYHYIKRMWTRNSYKKRRGCLGTIFHWIFIMMLFGACLYFIVFAGVFVLAIVGIVLIIAAIIYLIGKIVTFIIHKFKSNTSEEDLKIILDNESLTREKFKERSSNIPNTITSKERTMECITLKGLDPYTVDAGLLILKKDRATIGAIQRAFDIGFNRANMIMQQLELLGVVGPENGTKPRNILVSIDEFENIVLSNKYEDFSEYFNDNHFNNDGITPKNLNERFRSIEQYAVMCNAYLEHEDEMELYLDKTEE